jgi:hypothetical protein
MKQISLIASLLVIGCTCFAQRPATPKTYTVTLPVEQWQAALQSLDSANKVMIGSDAPARNVSYVASKLSFLIQTIQTQVGQQMQAEQKAEADSTKGKNPKK